jgi:hypothetical protein
MPDLKGTRHRYVADGAKRRTSATRVYAEAVGWGAHDANPVVAASANHTGPALVALAEHARARPAKARTVDAAARGELAQRGGDTTDTGAADARRPRFAKDAARRTHTWGVGDAEGHARPGRHDARNFPWIDLVAVAELNGTKVRRPGGRWHPESLSSEEPTHTPGHRS